MLYFTRLSFGRAGLPLLIRCSHPQWTGILPVDPLPINNNRVDIPVLSTRRILTLSNPERGTREPAWLQYKP